MFRSSELFHIPFLAYYSPGSISIVSFLIAVMTSVLFLDTPLNRFAASQNPPRGFSSCASPNSDLTSHKSSYENGSHQQPFWSCQRRPSDRPCKFRCEGFLDLCEHWEALGCQYYCRGCLLGWLSRTQLETHLQDSVCPECLKHFSHVDRLNKARNGKHDLSCCIADLDF